MFIETGKYRFCAMWSGSTLNEGMTFALWTMETLNLVSTFRAAQEDECA
jgi:hypothetical protein